MSAFRLIGVIHLPPLPGSPRYGGEIERIYARAAVEASCFAEWGFDGVILENFGDAPFLPQAVGPETVAPMAVCLALVRQQAPQLRLGVNVLRCDAAAALAVALASGASFIRVNVHAGARVADQGILEGRAHETLRQRAAWQAQNVAIFADVDVKHSRPLVAWSLDDQVRDLQERALADAILVTGDRTGAPPSVEQLREVRGVATVPVYLASGLTPECAHLAKECDGAIVSSSLRQNGRGGEPLDPPRAMSLLESLRPYR